MRILSTPKVYLIARPQIVEEGLQQFLSDNHLKWPTPTEGVQGCERLVEVAGRTCYQSYGNKAGSKTNFRYLQNIIGRNEDGTWKDGPAHGCYDAETDVLTESGWKSWPSVSAEDKLATLSKDGVVEYHKPLKLINYKYKGKMYFVDGKQVNLFVTPNHNMYVCLTSTLAGRRREGYQFITAEELDDKSHAYTKVGQWKSDEVIDPDIAKLLGFAIGDARLKNSYLDFHLRRVRKIKYLSQIVDDLGWEMKSDDDHYLVRIPDEWSELFGQIYSGKEKQIPPKLLFYNQIVLESLFDGLINSDGSCHNGAVSFDTTSEILIGQFQQLCLHIGKAANVAYRYDKSRRPTSFGYKPLTRFSIPYTGLKPEVNKFAGGKGKTSWVDWEGEVYCAEVPNHTLYVRRNGIPVWCGNSVTEHPCWSFLVTGTGRGFAQEQIRHRTGWAYSELSTRYCDFEREEEAGTWTPGFCIPPLAQLSYETSDMLAAKLHESQKNYIELLNSIEKDLLSNGELMANLTKRFPNERDRTRMIRKAARGAARDILPIATESIMVMSANARALWNCIVLRASEHAEAVIRSVYVQIARIMEKEMPALFYGIKYEKGWDGTDIVIMPRDKI